jgi:hypothetical protein
MTDSGRFDEQPYTVGEHLTFRFTASLPGGGFAEAERLRVGSSR